MYLIVDAELFDWILLYLYLYLCLCFEVEVYAGQPSRPIGHFLSAVALTDTFAQPIVEASAATSRGTDSQMQRLHFIAVLEMPATNKGAREEMQLSELGVVHIVCTPLHSEMNISLHGPTDLGFRRLRCIMQLTPFTHFADISSTLGKVKWPYKILLRT